MRWRPWLRLTAQIGLGVFAVATVAIWWGFETGWIINTRATGSFDLCGGRVQRTFDRFWTQIEQRQLDEREAYTIYARHGTDVSRKPVALKQCRSLADGDLQCEVHEADEIDGLRPGDRYRLARVSVEDWSYRRGVKFHRGCDPTRSMMGSFHNPCVRAARDNFSEFQWAATRDEMSPTDHWVDVQLETPEDVDLLDRPMEARLNRCERLKDGAFACRVDSAPPEAGLENDSRFVVQEHLVEDWSYRLGDQVGFACDGVEAERPLQSTINLRRGD